MKKAAFSLTLILLLFSAHSAWALDMEFYTYGGFDVMVQAFNTIALIFSDIGHKELMTVCALYGLVGGGIGWAVAVASGKRQVPLFWAIKVIAGAALYFALFVPTGNIAIYDATLNKTQTIGGVPDAVVFVAGVLNKVERAIVNICDTAAGPNASYSSSAGGIGFGLLQNMSKAQDVYATMSMENYMEKCVMFEVVRPSGTIGFADLTGNNTNFLNTLANAQNPAVFTVYYDATNTGGSPMSCTDAWTKLQPIFSSVASYDDALKKTCGTAFLNASDPAQLQTCKDLVSNTVNLVTGSSYTYDALLRQMQLSEMLYHTFMVGSPQSTAALQADRTITSSGFGTGVAMNQWIPIIKSILTGIAICLIPFLSFLLPTPLVDKAVTAMFGFFVFLTIWGIVDAIIHSAAVTYATNVFGDDIGANNLGMLAMAAMPTLSAKTLAMFGIIRSSGLMLAAVLSGMVIRFGGTALAHLAGSLTSIANQGGLAGGRMLTPEGRSAEQEELLRAWASMRVESEDKFANRGRALALDRERQIETANNAFAVAGSLGYGQEIQTVARMEAGQQNLTTNKGPVRAVVGPDGRTNMMDQTSMNEDGSRSDMTTGAGGAGYRTDLTRTSTKLSYALDGKGGENLTSATITGLDPLKATNTAMQMKIQGASHAFTRNNGIEKFLSEARQVGASDAVSKTHSDSLSKSFAANFERNIGEGSEFAKHVSWEEQKALKSFLGAHGGISALGNGISIGMDGSITFMGTDGHSFSMKTSESTANALRKAEGSAWSEAFSQTASTQEGMTWASSIAQKTGNTEAYSMLNDARNISRAQQSTGENLNAAFLMDYAKNHFDGSTTPEALRRSADYLSNKVTEGGAAGTQFVERAYTDFLNRSGYSNPTKDAVQQGIRDWGGQATGGPPGGVTDALSRTRSETGSVSPDAFRGRELGPWSEEAKGIQSRINERSSDINKEAREREATNHYNVNQGGSIPGATYKRPETEQEALHLSPGFEKEMNRIVQQAERGNHGDGGNR